MQSFREQLTAASSKGPVEGWPPTRWAPILEEFCGWLNDTHGEVLAASLGDSAAPRVHHVKIWPRGRRNQRSIMLSVHLTEDSARVLGAETPELRTEEAFRQFLADFVSLPSFHATIEELKEIVSQPVEGALRAGASWNSALLADVAVGVPPDEQRRLADAAEQASPPHIDRLYVVPSSRTRGGRYSRSTKPIWLVAGGYVLKLDESSDAQEEDGRIRLSGAPIPSSNL